MHCIELIRTSKSWDGVDMPDYLQGRPELVVMKYEFSAGEKLVHEGEAVVLYMFYLSQEGLPLSVQHPKIPLE